MDVTGETAEKAEEAARPQKRAGRGQPRSLIPAEEVNEDVAERLNVIAARLLQAHVGVDTGIARGTCGVCWSHKE